MADVSTTESGSDSSPDWGAQASTAFLDLVDNVRGKTTGPLLKAARAVVYGLVILVAALMLLGRGGWLHRLHRLLLRH